MTHLDDETLRLFQRRCNAAIDRARSRCVRRAEVRLDAVSDVLPLIDEVVRLRATIERVRQLHEEVSHPIIPFCDHCEHAWPCPTIAALGPAGADRQEQP